MLGDGVLPWRQMRRQPGKHFSEQALKFYIAEALLAMEYIHMLGIVYRDLSRKMFK